MWPIIRFLWNSTRGHHLAPWRSPYLKWRLETYTGIKMQNIGFFTFLAIMWSERVKFFKFLLWTSKMDRYAKAKPQNS